MFVHILINICVYVQVLCNTMTFMCIDTYMNICVWVYTYICIYTHIYNSKTH